MKQVGALALAVVFGVALDVSVAGGALGAASAIGRMKQFDIVCSLRGRVVADPHPSYVGTYPANARRWRFDPHYLIDLNRMKYCEISTCVTLGLVPIHAVTKTSVVFRTTQYFALTLRLSDLHMVNKRMDGESIEITQGYCRLAKFSGFKTDKIFVPPKRHWQGEAELMNPSSGPAPANG